MSLANKVAKNLLQIKAIKLNPHTPFTWASGILSPIYCDNRISLSHPNVRDLVKKGLGELAQNFDYDVIAGVATAGIPHGALLADYLNKPFIYVRDKAKGHGRQNTIEGEVNPGAKVLVIEDLISTGGSVLKAVDSLKEAGCEISGVLAIFTYGFDQADNAFKDAKVDYKTLTNYNILLTEAVENNYVSNEDLETLSDWRKSPKDWKLDWKQNTV